MKIALHIGMPKTGSTALQRGLAALRDPLREAGILYPKSRLSTHKHALSAVGLITPDRLPRFLLQKYEGDVNRLKSDAAAWLDQLAARVRANEHQSVILSDESLFYVNTSVGFEALSERLRSVADTIEVVAFVRRPSDYYLSMTQQMLKASHIVEPIQAVSYRETLEGYAKYLADTVHVVPYDRANWPDGDILKHFLSTYFPGVDVPLDSLTKQRNKSSMSAETMSIVAQYRKKVWPNSANTFTPDTRQLINAMNAAERELGGPRKPRLNESVRWHIDHSSTDLLWLRDAHGIVFEGIDYDRIGEPNDELVVETVEDICAVDPQHREDLMFHGLRRLTSR